MGGWGEQRHLISGILVTVYLIKHNLISNMEQAVRWHESNRSLLLNRPLLGPESRNEKSEIKIFFCTLTQAMLTDQQIFGTTPTKVFSLMLVHFGKKGLNKLPYLKSYNQSSL